MKPETGDITIWALSKYRLPDTLSAFADKTLKLLNACRETDQLFENLVAIGKDTTTAVPVSSEDFYTFVRSHAFDGENVADYLELPSNLQPSPKTLSKIGFSLSFISKGSDGSLLPAEDGGIELRLQGNAAGVDPSSSAVLRMPCRDGDAKAPLKALAMLARHWHCDFGGVYLPEFQNVIKPSDRASYAGQWLFYLPFPHLAKCLPPDIRHEPFANGILIETTPHMPDANNPDDVAAGKRVRDVLDEFGLVNDATYAIEGWPPDREETIYEQFITGAPANRKYTVHCINFDGYDPDRKVLLYAKLFRRLKRHPKEWGFRGWDGPVLNEAKRQVKAAAKAGGVPIEWHIGLEEPAHQVRQLLADHTNITEQQLRVIYTPLEQALTERPP
jgi:hypothetical protein